MLPANDLFVPGPRNLPAGLTEAGERYRARVVLVLGGLTLFLLVYLGLMAGSAWLLYWSCTHLSFASFLGGPVATVLLLFLIRGFFRRGRREKSLDVEITREQQPRLFEYIERLCGEVNAPCPRLVLLDPFVNASVGYEESILGLVRPGPKCLRIGLGLVNVLNLGEFKAVLAHEFGHCSQSSMLLGRYVYVANRIIHDLVSGRDWLDETLRRGCRAGGGFGALCQLCHAVLTGLRRLMVWLYYGINFWERALSREMEFNADLVAVRAAGSEAIPRGLARVEFASEALDYALRALKTAADHQLYTADLWYHHTAAMKYLRQVRKDPRLGEPPPVLADPMLSIEIFSPDDELPDRWSSHPSHYEREQNTKRHYVRWRQDERSPWLLFDEVDDIRLRVSWRFYRVAGKVSRDAVVDDAKTVQHFIDEEQRETTYDERYGGIYDNRFIRPGDLADVCAWVRSDPWRPDRLAAAHADLDSPEASARVAGYLERCREYWILEACTAQAGKQKREPIEFRGRSYPNRDAGRLLDMVRREVNADEEWLAERDRTVFRLHYQMGRELNPKRATELGRRYEFHLAVQNLLRSLRGQRQLLQSAVAAAQRRRELTTDDFRWLLSLLRQARAALLQTLLRADRLPLPPLKAMSAGEPLGHFLFAERLVADFRVTSRSISGKRIAKLDAQLGEVIQRLQRIHFKSLGGVLALQEEIAERWLVEHGYKRPPARPTAKAIPEATLVSEPLSTDPARMPDGRSRGKPGNARKQR
ncbi:MAG TPA: M48 family metallopeptidase [Gemmataceae bacterium]|nr:M48 family metallopeptidase [Gemmataceae bacterium]